MSKFKALFGRLVGNLGKPIAAPDTDPQRFFNSLFALPNPDPILRQMGGAEKVYYSIATDPHVLGDIRSIRGNFRSHSYRLNPGDEGDTKSLAAHALCEDWMKRCQPNKLSDWLEVMWQMSSAFMTGYRPHELVWTVQDGSYLPEQVIDRPGRRFRFNNAGEPLLISTGNMMGAPVDPWQFVLSRHMADHDNPYGIAVLSSCFWSWTFKTGGWKYFMKYCERHGLPWPIARYPIGTGDKEIDTLEAAVADMIEAGYIVAAEGTGLELLTPSGSAAGGLPQQHLIDLANREMSKALTGQAMVAELQGAGARAASETAMKRQESIDDSVRDIAAQSMGSIFRWITLFNFGDGIAPPQLEFFQHENAGKDRAEAYGLAADMGAKPSRKGLLEELGIPAAEDDADAIHPRAPKQLAAPALPSNVPDSTATQAGTTPGGNPGGTQQRGKTAANDATADQAKAANFARGLAQPLYASRKVLNADAIVEWARLQGLNPVPADELHVTVAWSSTPLLPAAIEPDGAGLTIEGGARSIKRLGDEGAVVLCIDSTTLQSRWQAYIDAGASWDFDGYEPHITITYDTAGMDPALAQPYSGPLALGPEVVEPLQLTAPRADLSAFAGFEFARAAGMTDDEALALATEAADQAIADHMIAPVAQMLADYEAAGRTLAEFQADLSRMVGVMDTEALREVIDRSLKYSILRGAATQAA